jgi:CRISPR-associated endonuclease/helicase Cas3
VEQNQGALNLAHDPTLVLHLIGTHHGRGRPFLAPVVDENTEIAIFLTDKAMLPTWNGAGGGLKLRASSLHRLERVDSGWIDRFWAMVRRHGWWGLAFLEAILQLADHRCSEEGESRRNK